VARTSQPFGLFFHRSQLSAEQIAMEQKFSCSKCRLWLASGEDQRVHFQSPLHAFNVRRAVVNMVPVSQEEFERKLAESQTEVPETVAMALACRACNKKFKSDEQLEQHLQSKKHLKAAQGKTTAEVVEKRPAGKKPAAAEEEATSEAEAVAKRIEKGRRLGFVECVFCSHKSETAEETAEHMSDAHGFFIPDVEFLVNLEGLLSYLGDKVGVGFCCVYCHRVFESMQAARQHMDALSHAKMVFNDDEDAEAGEYDEFYDFADTYGEDAVRRLPELVLSADGTQLRLGDSGKSIGHRDMRPYYEQNVRDPSEKQLAVAALPGARHRLLKKYKALGWSGTPTALETVAARREKQIAFKKMQREKLAAGMQTTKTNGRWFRRRDIHW
jgi:pre-60S factor REI1